MGVIEKIKVFEKAISTLREADDSFNQIRQALDRLNNPFYDIDDVMSKLDDIEAALKVSPPSPA